MNINELIKDLKRLKKEDKVKYTELIQTAQKRFKWARDACNLSQEKLAKKLLLDRGTIIKSENKESGQLEAGRVEIFVNNYLLKFSKLYCTDWREFLTICQSQDWEKKHRFKTMILINKEPGFAGNFLVEKSKSSPP